MDKADNAVVKSASRVFDLLEFIGASEVPVPLTEIAEKLKIPRSSLYQLITTMASREYIQQVSSRGGYVLGRTIDSLGRRGTDFVVRLKRVMEEVADRHGETTVFTELQQDAEAIVASEVREGKGLICRAVGERAPLYATAAGLVLLAQQEPDWLEDYLRRTTLEPATPYTIQSIDELKRRIETVAACGFAISQQEFILGVNGVAVPMARGERRGALSIVLPTVRFDEAPGEALIQTLLIASNNF